MKKLFSFLLALCMTISLAACGQQVGSGGTSSKAYSVLQANAYIPAHPAAPRADLTGPPARSTLQ